MEIRKTAKIKNAEKTDILTRTVSTGVFTNSVFFCFLCFFQFCIFCWKHYKNRGFSPKKTKKNKKNNKILKLKTGPS